MAARKRAPLSDTEKTAERIRRNIDAEWKMWEVYKKTGGQDPFYADGVNMNLIRNHILALLNDLSEVEKQPMQLDVFGGEVPAQPAAKVPPEVSPQYMARKDEILHNARMALIELGHSGSHQGLRDYGMLQHAIDTRDYVTMRRYEIRLLSGRLIREITKA